LCCKQSATPVPLSEQNCLNVRVAHAISQTLRVQETTLDYIRTEVIQKVGQKNQPLFEDLPRKRGTNIISDFDIKDNERILHIR